MSKTKLHQRRRNHLLYLVGTAFLIIALAFFNRYPLVYSDTGTYIRSAFTLHPPVDRPIGYSLIIRAVTCKVRYGRWSFSRRYHGRGHRALGLVVPFGPYRRGTIPG